MRAGGHLWLGVWSRQWRTAAARTLPGLPAVGIPLAPEWVGGGAGRGRGGAEPCRAAPKELSVQWEDREVGSTVSWGPRRGSLPEQCPLRQKGLGSEGPAEGRASAQKGRGAPLKGTSFLSGLRSHTIIHTLTAQ